MAVYGWGLKRRVVGIGFWALSGLAVAAVIASFWVKDGEAEKAKQRNIVAKHGVEERLTVHNKGADVI